MPHKQTSAADAAIEGAMGIDPARAAEHMRVYGGARPTRGPGPRPSRSRAERNAAQVARAASAIAHEAPTKARPPTGPAQSPRADQSFTSPAPMPAEPKALLARAQTAMRNAHTHATPEIARAAAATGSAAIATDGTRAAATRATHQLGISRVARSRNDAAARAPMRTTAQRASAMFPKSIVPPLRLERHLFQVRRF